MHYALRFECSNMYDIFFFFLKVYIHQVVGHATDEFQKTINTYAFVQTRKIMSQKLTKMVNNKLNIILTRLHSFIRFSIMVEQKEFQNTIYLFLMTWECANKTITLIFSLFAARGIKYALLFDCMGTILSTYISLGDR